MFHIIVAALLFGCVACARLNKHALTMIGPSPPAEGLDRSAPLEGCGANYWEPTCCCFIDAGILKQSTCECSSKASACNTVLRLRYFPAPSRPIDWDNKTQPRWISDDGYLSGYQAVEDDFCKAAPVGGPQIDSLERPYSCTCSSSMGQAAEMECGSSCSVENCMRWKNNANSTDIDWKPLQEGRGKCCLSSFVSDQEGCPQEATPITESGAQDILKDALELAVRGSQQRNSFLVAASEHLVGDMTKSFEMAKEKKMSTSRSGAQFFFSGDYGYILKSIHPAEYDVLFDIAATRESGTSPLSDHIDLRKRTADLLGMAGNCMTLRIELDISSWTDEVVEKKPALKLAKLVDSRFLGHWEFQEHHSQSLGVPVYIDGTGTYLAVWCKPQSRWAMLRKMQDTYVNLCKKLANDPLYTWLSMDAKKTSGIDDAMVDVVYQDFMLAFQEKTSDRLPIGSGSVYARCQKHWWPATLINDFVLAFKYQASSTWMVVKNSVETVSQALTEHGFTKFYKEKDVFDVKPLPIISEQRQSLFGMHFVRDTMSTWRHWQSVRNNLAYDVAFMNNALNNPMVDYSLLVSAFYVDDSRRVLSEVHLPNCVESPLASMRTYPNARGSILACFTVIDLLMEFTNAKIPENALLFNKWTNWGGKIMDMFDCLGNPRSGFCSGYVGYLAPYEGVDLPAVETATIVDVTSYFSGDGEVIVKQSFGDVRKKCCCVARADLVGVCVLATIPNASRSTGCGSIAGSGWHSYWRYAKRCNINRKAAFDMMEKTSGAEI